MKKGRINFWISFFLMFFVGCSLFSPVIGQNTYPWQQTGNVGIGSTSPEHKLEITDYTNIPTLGLRGNFDSKIIFEPVDGSDRFLIWADMDGSTTNDLLRFQTKNTGDALVIKGNGKVGIGTINPKHVFEISNTAITPTLGIRGNFDSKIIFEPVDGSDRFSIWADMDGTTTNDLLRFQTKNTGDVMVIKGNGKVGVGTINPQHNLEILNTASTPTLGIRGNFDSKIIFEPVDGSDRFSIWADMDGSTTNDLLRFQTKNTGDALVISGNGRVGIACISPNYELDVAGTIRADEVKVNLEHGADFVFSPTYNLPTLTEVETFIKENKHLPDVPPANQMETEGINVAEMNALLLQKIEELTLYVIEQNKEIEMLKQKSNNLEK